MDIAVVLTGVGVVLAIAGVNIGLIAWLRSDIKSFESEIRGWRQEINKEITDFHGRLCVTEERSRGVK